MKERNQANLGMINEALNTLYVLRTNALGIPPRVWDELVRDRGLVEVLEEWKHNLERLEANQ